MVGTKSQRPDEALRGLFIGWWLIVSSKVEVNAYCVLVGGGAVCCDINWREGRTSGRMFSAIPPSESSSSPKWKLHGRSPSLMTQPTCT